jgi:hypothetical protein
MRPSARHEQVELSFRQLVGDAGLVSPDRVEYVRESVIFYWDGPRVAVYVDFDCDDEPRQRPRQDSSLAPAD